HCAETIENPSPASRGRVARVSAPGGGYHAKETPPGARQCARHPPLSGEGSTEELMKADLVIRNGWIVTPQETVRGGVAIADGKFVAIGTDQSLPDAAQVIDVGGHHILPGIIDAHVHFRDPGVTHKE